MANLSRYTRRRHRRRGDASLVSLLICRPAIRAWRTSKAYGLPCRLIRPREPDPPPVRYKVGWGPDRWTGCVRGLHLPAGPRAPTRQRLPGRW